MKSAAFVNVRGTTAVRDPCKTRRALGWHASVADVPDPFAGAGLLALVLASGGHRAGVNHENSSERSMTSSKRVKAPSEAYSGRSHPLLRLHRSTSVTRLK